MPGKVECLSRFPGCRTRSSFTKLDDLPPRWQTTHGVHKLDSLPKARGVRAAVSRSNGNGMHTKRFRFKPRRAKKNLFWGSQRRGRKLRQFGWRGSWIAFLKPWQRIWGVVDQLQPRPSQPASPARLDPGTSKKAPQSGSMLRTVKPRRGEIGGDSPNRKRDARRGPSRRFAYSLRLRHGHPCGGRWHVAPGTSNA